MCRPGLSREGGARAAASVRKPVETSHQRQKNYANTTPAHQRYLLDHIIGREEGILNSSSYFQLTGLLYDTLRTRCLSLVSVRRFTHVQSFQPLAAVYLPRPYELTVPYCTYVFSTCGREFNNQRVLSFVVFIIINGRIVLNHDEADTAAVAAAFRVVSETTLHPLTPYSDECRYYFGQKAGSGRCWMGGYYSEPEDITRSDMDDDRPKHMLFGMECIEDIVSLPDIMPLKVLIPSSSMAKPQFLNTVRMAEELLTNVDLPVIETMVELGSSVVSLAAARAGTANVMAHDIDGGSLRILEHTASFVNSPGIGGIQTVELTSGSDLLPRTTTVDLVVVTAQIQSHDPQQQPFLEQAVQEAIDRKIPLILAANSLNESYIKRVRNGEAFSIGSGGNLICVDPLKRLFTNSVASS